MPTGPLGGPRPFADPKAKIQFGVLASEVLAQETTRVDLNNVARQSIVGAVGDDRVDPRIISDTDTVYDPMSNNLFVNTYFRQFLLSLHDIESFAEDFHQTLVSVLENRTGMDINNPPLSDLPPNENTFVLIDQGSLAENVFVAVR